MKYLLYMSVAILVSSVECKVIRQISNGIDKPSSNRIVHCPSGCSSTKVRHVPISESDPVNGLETSVSHLPPSPSNNEVVGQDREQNEVIAQDGELESNVVNKREELIGAFVPKVGKRDLRSQRGFRIGERFGKILLTPFI